jgi:succinoglycan biosynthesis transport protein ExoP
MSRHLADPEDGLPPAGFPFAATTENEGVRSTAFTHSMRGVFAALDPARTDGVGRRIAVGALTPGEDSAAIALELARQAVSSGRRCLLVDADFTTAELTRRLRLTDAPGTMHVLDGTTGLGAALCGSFADDLDVLPVGESAEAAPPIAYMAEFAELIADLSDGYDDVVIALPPLLDAPEARGLLRQADSTILVVAWGQTSRRLVRSCLDHDPMLRVQGTAVVLSRVNLRKLARYGVTRSGRTRRQSGRAWAKTP